MPRHDHQKGLSMNLQNLFVSGQQMFVLAFMSTARNPYWPRRKIAFDGCRCDTDTIWNVHIKFYTARNCNLLRSNANTPKALGIFFCLSSNPAYAAHNGRGEASYALIATGGAFRKPCVYEEYRYISPPTLANHIWPDFGFHNNENTRVGTVEKSADGARRIVWRIGILHLITKHLAGLSQPGVSHGRH